MSKPVLVFQAPVGTRSGYGERSRDLVRSLIALDKFDIKIVSTRWGATPMNALTELDTDILDRILVGNLAQQPEIFMQVTVPNEFQKVGKYNIGVTAGIETNLCDHTWLEGCNRMDLVLASSEHAKAVFEGTSFDKKDSSTGQIVESLKLTTPVEVLFEGVRLNTFQKKYTGEANVAEIFDQIPEDFCFLFVGHWLSGNIGEDRKNVGLMIKLFLETFKGKGVKPALILKTSHGPASIMDRDEILKKIDAIRQTVAGQNLPNIYLLHGELQDEDMNYLYNHPKVKTMISFTKGEGFGRPLLEFSLIKKPIIVSGWSGHMDFLNPEFTTFIFGELRNIHESAANDMLLKESQWFNVVESSAVDAMKDIYKNYDKQIPKAKQQAHKNKQSFSIDKMQERLDEVFEKYIPKKVELKLPKFDKIELPK